MHQRNRALPPLLVRILIGTLVDALLALICYRLQLNLATTSLLFLLSVVIQALEGGVASSIVASIVAAGFLDYFFVPPVLNLRIADPFNAVALAAFITTSLVITNLASKASNEAKRAERRRKALEHLYQASQRLLWMEPEANVIRVILATFREVFGLRAACLFDGTTAVTHLEGESARLAGATRQTYITGTDSDDTHGGIFVRCLRQGGRVTGALGFENLGNPELTAGPLVTLAIATLDRAHASQTASQATAEAQAEVFRAAVLDALAHEFKTPLAVIATAAGAIRETGQLTENQCEMAETIEEEVQRLGYLTTRLLANTAIDPEEVKPRLQESDLVTLAQRVVARCAGQSADSRIRLESDRKAAPAMADGELFCLALSQLLDNAVKYSQPGSRIVVKVVGGRETITVRVWNSGSSIPAAERHRIFERFYRGTHGRQAIPGSGLGLYVARKIARAHGGSLEVDPDCMDHDGTTFCLTLPLLRRENQGANPTDQSVSCR